MHTYHFLVITIALAYMHTCWRPDPLNQETFAMLPAVGRKFPSCQRAGSGVVWLWHPGILCAVLPWCSHATRRLFFLPTFACQPGVLLACLVNWKKRTDNNRQVNLEKARLLINGFQFWIYFMKSIRTVDCHARLKQKQNVEVWNMLIWCIPWQTYRF